MIVPAEHRSEILEELSRTPDVRIHFSQFGEDCVIWHLFGQVLGGYYVDIGCHHPTRYSNTFLLWKFRNWRGINVDADPRAIERFNEARPGDVNLNLGVGLTDGTRKFTMFHDGAVNTFDAAAAEHQQKNFQILEHRDIDIKPLRSILRAHLPADQKINYLNVDCEGYDDEVLKSSDWNAYRPEIITVELHGLNMEQPLENSCINFLRSVGYRFRSFYYMTGLFERVH